MTQPAGQGATIEYRFRNGTSVELTANEINVPKLLDDVKAYIKSRPAQFDWQKINIGDLGFRLVQENQKQYVGRQVASWKLDLKPREAHFDSRITITTPLQKPGAYLLTAKMAGGNTSLIVVWRGGHGDRQEAAGRQDLLLRRRRGDRQAGAQGERRVLRLAAAIQRQRPNLTDRHQGIRRDERRRRPGDPRSEATSRTDFQWLVIARTQQGRFAYLGFTNVWYGQRYDAEYNRTRSTRSPTARSIGPGRPWTTSSGSATPSTTRPTRPTSPARLPVEIHNPKGEKIVRDRQGRRRTAASRGSCDLPADATLGVYQLMIVNLPVVFRRRRSFRVEEYKKPEFEVTVDAPAEPVMLGEKIRPRSRPSTTSARR